MDFQNLSLRHASEQPKVPAVMYSPAEWELKKPLIERLYVHEGRTCKETMAILRENGFPVTEKQIKSRLTKWNFDTKYVRGDTMRMIGKSQARRRELDGKESVFRVNNKTIPPRNIKRYLARKNISENELLLPGEADDKVQYTVHTPRSTTPSQPIDIAYLQKESHHPTLFHEPDLPIYSDQWLLLKLHKDTSNIFPSMRGLFNLPNTKSTVLSAALQSTPLYYAVIATAILRVSDKMPMAGSRVAIQQNMVKSYRCFRKYLEAENVQPAVILATSLVLYANECELTDMFGTVKSNRMLFFCQTYDIVTSTSISSMETFSASEVFLFMTSLAEYFHFAFEFLLTILTSFSDPDINIYPGVTFVPCCIRGLFPVIGLITSVKFCMHLSNREGLSFQQGTSLLHYLKEWEPDSHPNQPSETREELRDICEAYRYATIVYLCQIIPGILSPQFVSSAAEQVVRLIRQAIHSETAGIAAWPFIMATSALQLARPKDIYQRVLPTLQKEDAPDLYRLCEWAAKLLDFIGGNRSGG